jgi:hypothetical protein
MDLDKFKSMMPVMPEVMKSIITPPPPPIDYNWNLPKRYFHNRKLEDIAKAKRLSKEIAKDSDEQLQYNLNTIMQMITFTAKMGDALAEISHREKTRQTELELKQEQLNEQRMKNYQLNLECQKSDFILKQMLKENEDG